MEPQRSFRNLRFPVGQYSAVGAYYADPNNAAAAYPYQLEANGSATYLTKVTAPDGAAAIISDTPFPSRAIFCCRTPTIRASPSGYLSFQQPMDPLPPDWYRTDAAAIISDTAQLGQHSCRRH